MTERADFDARKQSGAFGPAGRQYRQRWPDGAPWPDSSDHRQAQLPALPLPRPRPETVENAVRGTVFALTMVPAGVALWLILRQLGWMASIVGFMTAAGAARLYLAGSTAGRAGIMTRRGAWVVAAVTGLTVVLAFAGTLWLATADYLGTAPLALMFEPGAREFPGYNLADNPELVQGPAREFLPALPVSALGCFVTLRQLSARSRRG